MSLYRYIFSVSLLCIVEQINSNSYDITFTSYHSYAPNHYNVTKVERTNSEDLIKTNHIDEIRADQEKHIEHIIRIYDSYRQLKANRSRRSYDTSTLPQNSTGRVDSFKTYEISSNDLINAKYDLTKNPNFIEKNNTARHNIFQRRRQEGMFLNTSAPVSNRRLTFFNSDVLNNSLSRKNNLINFVNISNNRVHNCTNKQLDNHSLTKMTANSNRWFRRKHSPSKVERNGEKYSIIKHLEKRQLKDNKISEDNSGRTLTILKKMTPKITDTTQTKKLKIHQVLQHDKVVNVKPLLQFTTLSVIDEPHDDTVMIQVPNRRIHCEPPRRLAHGRCREVW